MIDRIDRIDIPKEQNSVRFQFKEASTSFEKIVSFNKVQASIGDKILCSDLEFDLSIGETLGIIGPNGCGKSTILRMIINSQPASSSNIWISSLAKPVYFDQQLESITSSGTVLEALHDASPLSKEGELRTHLARFLFSRDNVNKRIESLSGGERSRALLAKISLFKTNLLILDEPTNHMDIYTRESLEETIRSFSGATIIVSHDRRLLDEIVDKLLIVGAIKSTLHVGNYSSYTDSLKKTDSKSRMKKASKKATSTPAKKVTNQKRRTKRLHTFEDLESLIITKEDRLAEIHDDIYKEEVYSDPIKYKEIEAEQTRLKEDLEALYKEWDTWT